MPNIAKKKVPLEILVATMHRSSLLFLEAMFPHASFWEYSILVINQTTQAQLLESTYDNVRVINSFDKGLPNSRNLAIKHAEGEICLIADDDVVYASDFDTIIRSGFDKYENADMVTFQMHDLQGRLFRDYMDIEQHDKKSIATANSVVIAFKREKVLKASVKFNSYFGLGAEFETANEYVFLRNALKSGLKLFYVPEVILSHDSYSSGQDISSDRVIYARAALYYKYSGSLGYLRIIKVLFLAYQDGQIPRNEISNKVKVAFQGIAKYKSLVR
ncbi:MAG: glycosyltransferase [Flavobacteriaceae bacterium]|nr:glycosyltransferase [Flavobacteriaceae bacterium]